jgi:hypothetical protein
VGAAPAARVRRRRHPLIVQDVRLEDDGRLADGGSPFSPTGPSATSSRSTGPRRLPRRPHGAHPAAAAQRLAARVYAFGFDDERDFAIVGTDGGLLPRPVTAGPCGSPRRARRDRRAVRPGAGPCCDPGLPSWAATRSRAAGRRRRPPRHPRAAARRRLAPSPALPSALAALPRGGPRRRDAHATCELGGTEINGRQLAHDRIDAAVPVGATELWKVRNESGTPHNFHVQRRPVPASSSATAAPPGRGRAGLKDTSSCRRRRRDARVTFPGPADPASPYMFHCHLPPHEDAGMMGQFVVAGPASARAPGGHGVHRPGGIGWPGAGHAPAPDERPPPRPHATTSGSSRRPARFLVADPGAPIAAVADAPGGDQRSVPPLRRKRSSCSGSAATACARTSPPSRPRSRSRIRGPPSPLPAAVVERTPTR